MAFLKVISGSVPGQIIELTEDQTVLGRHPNSQIVLDNAAVSRHHAQILFSHGRYFLEDLRSRNGTFLNDEAVIERQELHERDRIDICEIILQFSSEHPDSEAVESDFQVGPAEGEPPASVTRIGQAIVDSDVPDHAMESSSILGTLDVMGAGSEVNDRLAINSEAKLRGVLEISRALNRVLDVDDALQRTLECLFRIFPQADEGFAMLIDEETGQPVVRSIQTKDPKREGRVSRTIVQQALKEKSSLLSEDVQSDHRFSGSKSIAGTQLRSLMCVPLLDSEQNPLGVIQLAAHTLANPFTEAELDLFTAIGGQTALALENAALHQQMVAQRELQRDLEHATQIQLGFLPSHRPELARYEFADFYEAAQSVGGDYFDYIELPDRRWAFTIADVAGKGVSAALLMARLYSAARYHLLTKENVARAMEGLNEEFATGGVGHRFVTCILAVLDLNTNRITLSNAGHLPPILRHAGGDVEEVEQETAGFPLGVERDYEYSQIEFELQPGETMLLYTDGTSEATNADYELFGVRRLKTAVSNASPQAEELIQSVLDEVEEFSGEDTFQDDICLVALHRRSETE
jgi:serine phosphatase RsbU (regulator of sigma subunit)